MKRYGYLIQEIVKRDNLEESFYEVTNDLPKWSKEYYESQRDDILDKLEKSIKDGSFRITRFEEFEVKDGPKTRRVQSPPVVERIGCNAVMRIVEKYVYPRVIPTSAASIKGRGMHKLFRKVRSDVKRDPEGTRYYYKCDIKKFYESIDQKVMKAEIRRHIKDPILLPILDNFITVMEHGLSIGLRSSQCYGNILLSALDHLLKEVYHVRYYYRYCDDIVVLDADKKKLWKIRNKIHDKMGEIGLTIKGDEAVRPITEGLDFLGFVFDGKSSRIRKRTKQKFARKMKKVKSSTRRKQLIGSFFGMAKWGDCRHLLKTILDKKIDMNEFKNLGLVYEPADGKKQFGGKAVPLGQLMNLHIVIMDFEEGVHTQYGDRTLVQFQYDNGTSAKYFTDDKVQLQLLRAAKERGVLPFATTIGMENFGKGVRYVFT